MRIIAVVGEGVRLVRNCERVRFSPLVMVSSVRRFAPRSASPLTPPLQMQSRMNVSHYIHDITYGEHFSKVSNPLRSVANGIDDGVGLVQFYVKVIPTMFKRPGRWERETFQISMTEQFVKVREGRWGGSQRRN